MTSDWLATTLGNICKVQGGAIQTGPFGSQLHTSDYKQLGIPVVMPTNIGDGGIVTDGIARVGSCDVERLSQHKLRLDDIVFSRRGDVTKNALIRKHEVDWLCGTGCLKVRLGDESIANAKFISHCLRSPEIKGWLVRHAVGATMPNLNTGILSAVPIHLPPLQIQLQIAEILGALDHRIAILRAINTTLEAITQALFKSWFVDFDPVRAKQEGRAPECMNEATAALFPGSFEESELGLVPRGWKVVRSGDVVDIRDGTHDSPKQASSGYPFITTRHISTGKIDLKNAYLISEEDYVDFSRRSKVDTFDVLISMIGTVGIPVIVLKTKTDFAVKNIGILKTGFEKKLSHFMYLLLKSRPIQQQIESRLAGTTQKYLALSALRDIKFVLPSSTLLESFSQVAMIVFSRISHNDEVINSITSLRDTLLPRLISGQLHLPEAEALMKEAA